MHALKASFCSDLLMVAFSESMGSVHLSSKLSVLSSSASVQTFFSSIRSMAFSGLQYVRILGVNLKSGQQPVSIVKREKEHYTYAMTLYSQLKNLQLS